MSRVLVLSLLLAGALPAQASFGSISAQDGGACATTGACVLLALPANARTVMVQATGTFSATGTLQVTSAAGGVWVTATCVDAGGAGAKTTVTAAAVLQCNVAGASAFRIRGTAWTSGSMVVTLSGSTG